MNTQPSYESATLTPVQCLTNEGHKPARIPLMIAVRRDVALMGALAAADAMAQFNLLQAEWQEYLAACPQFADDFESSDPYVCDVSQLAELVAQAPTAVIRQVLRETWHCREQMAMMLDLAAPKADERAEMVLAGANAEWEILVSVHTTFSALLSTIDRLTCSRATLAELILHAPTCTIRHALRETFCFREVAALITAHKFD